MSTQLFFLHSVLLPLLKAAKMGLIDVFFADGVHLTYGYQGRLLVQRAQMCPICIWKKACQSAWVYEFCDL